jgi:hypothetical protein
VVPKKVTKNLLVSLCIITHLPTAYTRTLEKSVINIHFMHRLFNDAVSSSDCITSNDKMIVSNELGRIRKEAAVAYFGVLSLQLTVATEQNHEKP